MIFVDLGAYNGDTVDQFISWGQLLGDISDATVYAFEPNPNFEEEWGNVYERQIKHVKDIRFEQEAAWVDDKGLEFSLWKESDIGSTVMKEKRNWYAGKVIGVQSFDFSDWLKQVAQVHKGEDIYVKFDIEGAEYPILKKMIADGTDKLCKLLMIEWHADKMGEQFKEDQKFIEENLNCKWIEWR
jgi:FkbM family methyltransferase